MQLPFRRSAGDVEQHRDLAMLIALNVVEDEDLAGAGRQLLDGLLECDRQIGACRGTVIRSSAAGSSLIRSRWTA